MDPDACFSMILSSIASGEFIEAVQHAENLREWHAKGGFPPGGGKLRDSSIHEFVEWVITHPQRDD